MIMSGLKIMGEVRLTSAYVELALRAPFYMVGVASGSFRFPFAVGRCFCAQMHDPLSSLYGWLECFCLGFSRNGLGFVLE